MTTINFAQDNYYLIRFKPTGALIGKGGSHYLTPESFYLDVTAARCGLSHYLKALAHPHRTWDPFTKVPGCTLRTNYEIVCVNLKMNEVSTNAA